MNLETLKKEWVTLFDVESQTQRWDDSAESFSKHPIPDVDKDIFLRNMKERDVLRDEYTILDIGCGTGVYSIAISPFVKSVVGCDLSGKMLEAAEKNADENGAENVSFEKIDWHAVDIVQLGWEKKFDVVFAHMTPAINDFDTFDKMVRCAKKYCFFQTTLRRHNLLTKGAFKAVGLGEPGSGMRDEDAVDAFAYFWLNGYNPEVMYKNGYFWSHEHTIDEAFEICQKRISEKKTFTESDATNLKEYLYSVAKDGVVLETTSGTTVIMSCELKTGGII